MKTSWKSLSFLCLIIGFSWSLIGCQDDTDPLDEYPRYVENPAPVQINLTGIAVDEQGEIRRRVQINTFPYPSTHKQLPLPPSLQA